MLLIQYCLEYLCGVIKMSREEFDPLCITLYHYCQCSRARVWWAGSDCQWPGRSVLGLGSGEGRVSGCSISRPPPTAIGGVPVQHMPPTSLPCSPPVHMQTKICTLNLCNKIISIQFQHQHHSCTNLQWKQIKIKLMVYTTVTKRKRN